MIRRYAFLIFAVLLLPLTAYPQIYTQGGGGGLPGVSSDGMGGLAAQGDISARGYSGLPVPPTSVVGIGDSITFGYGASLNNSGYAYLLANDLGSPLTDLGINGLQDCDIADQEAFFQSPGQTGAPFYIVLAGTNDAWKKGVGSYEAVAGTCYQSMLSWLSIPSTSKVLGQSASNTTTGTWTNDSSYGGSVALASSVSGSTLSIPISTTGGPIYAWYILNDTYTGTGTYALDSGTATAFSSFTSPAIATYTGGTRGVGFIRFTGVTAGSHTVKFTTTNNGVVSIIGVGTVPPSGYWLGEPTVYAGGVLKEQNDQNSAATAEYDSDNSTWASQLFSDGLNIFFVPVRPYVNSTTDMYDQYHPNQTGCQHLANAFHARMQYTPKYFYQGTTGGIINPNGPVGAQMSVSGQTSPTPGQIVKWDSTGVALVDTTPADLPCTTWAVINGFSPCVSLGSNLLVNGGFEGSWSAGLATGWSLLGTATASQNKTLVHSGFFSQGIQGAAANDGLSQAVTTTAGIWYQFTAWTYTTSGTAQWVAFTNGTSNVLDATTTSSSNNWNQFLAAGRSVGTSSTIYIRQSGSSPLLTAAIDDCFIQPIALNTTLFSFSTWSGSSTPSLSAAVTALPLDANNAFPMTQAGLAIKLDSYTAPANGIFAYVGPNGNAAYVYLDKLVAGTWTNVASAAVTYSAGAVLKIGESSASSNSYTVSYNGSAVISSQTISDSSIASNVLDAKFATNWQSLVGTTTVQ
jgi:hypothetical protein